MPTQGLRQRGEPPDIIKQVGFDFHWSEEKVWKLSLPIEEMDIKELLWHLDYPWWRDHDGQQYRVTPKQVIDDPKAYHDQYNRIVTADVSHPVDIMFYRNHWIILDGMHRLLKLFLEGKTKVSVRKVPVESIPLIRR